MKCAYVVFFFFTVNSPFQSVNTARSALNGVCRRKFHGKGIKLKNQRQLQSRSEQRVLFFHKNISAGHIPAFLRFADVTKFMIGITILHR